MAAVATVSDEEFNQAISLAQSPEEIARVLALIEAGQDLNAEWDSDTPLTLICTGGASGGGLEMLQAVLAAPGPRVAPDGEKYAKEQFVQKFDEEKWDAAAQPRPELSTLNTAAGVLTLKTPLMCAAQQGWVEGVRLLLAQPGIDVAAKTDDGETAADIADGDEVAALLRGAAGS